MQMKGSRGAAALAAVLACAGCGKKADQALPLAFVPADTPYVIANLESVPDATMQRWTQQMQGVWPVMIGNFDHAIAELGKSEAGARYAPVLRALLDEARERDTPEKWQQIGLAPKLHSAFYGVGLLPVVRIELADPAAFRAMISRIEQKAGDKLATAKVGEQEVWTFGTDPVQGLMAIEDKHLIVTAVPSGADDALKRRVLGLDRPEHNLAEGTALADLNKARGYLPYGSGWIDLRRLLALLLDDPSVAALAHALGEAPPTFEASCRGEFDRIADNAPRLSFGYSALDTERMALQARLDLAPAIAQALARIAGTPPGPPAASDVLFDFGLSLPLLKARDFWVDQADAVAKSPFQCSVLAPLNESFVAAKAQIDQTIPPPLADLTGVRVTIDRFAWTDTSKIPDVGGFVLIGSNNPGFLVNLAQVSMPALRNVKLGTDAKPVAIPAEALPGAPAAAFELNAAMSAKTLGLSVGKDMTTRLGTAVAAAPAQSGVLLDASYSGALYTLINDGIGRFADAIPAEQRAQLEAQRKLYAMYAQWFKRFDVRISVGADGIDFSESVEFAKQ